jgi:RNA polymerase primary sigma factor
MENEKIVEIPVHILEQLRNVVKETKQAEQEFGRKPTNEEIALRLGWTDDRGLKRLMGMKNIEQDILEKTGYKDLEELLEKNNKLSK